MIALITPALASANNGNWQTARRWARLLSNDYRVRLAQRWDGTPADAMIALHARRSADSIADWAAQTPRRPLLVALTGTDLYRDLPAGDASALRSIALSDRLIVLHEGAPADVPQAQRHKCVVCFQSTAARRPLPKSTRRLRAVAVGHLRTEKDPRTLFAAMRRLRARADVVLDQVGTALDDALGREARDLMAECPGYRWLGPLSHAAALARIQRAHVLVQPSLMEGGAHAVLEAVRCGTPVLASRVPGNVGMLGTDYDGYFEPGDDAALAALLQRVRDEPAMLDALRVQCARRAPRFDPARERDTLVRAIAPLLEDHAR